MPEAMFDLPPHLYWMIALWLLFVGGCIGSFMNVVVYRLPAGLSIVHPGSHCPKCEHAIRWHDNLPVLGWLILGGKCRDCGKPISLRYPLVEAAVAAMSFFLAMAGPLSSGANLPSDMIPWDFVEGGWREVHEGILWVIYAFHLFLLCTLLCAGLIQYDGQRTPRSLFGLVFIVGVIASLIWTAPVFVSDHIFRDWYDFLYYSDWNGAFYFILLCTIFGAIISALGNPPPLLVIGHVFAFRAFIAALCNPTLIRMGPAGRIAIERIIFGALCGLYLGFEGVLIVVFLSSLIALAAAIIGRIARKLGNLIHSMSILLAILWLLLQWRFMTEILAAWVSDLPWLTWGHLYFHVALAILILSWIARRLAPREEEQKENIVRSTQSDES